MTRKWTPRHARPDAVDRDVALQEVLERHRRDLAAREAHGEQRPADLHAAEHGEDVVAAHGVEDDVDAAGPRLEHPVVPAAPRHVDDAVRRRRLAHVAVGLRRAPQRERAEHLADLHGGDADAAVRAEHGERLPLPARLEDGPRAVAQGEVGRHVVAPQAHELGEVLHAARVGQLHALVVCGRGGGVRGRRARRSLAATPRPRRAAGAPRRRCRRSRA